MTKTLAWHQERIRVLQRILAATRRELNEALDKLEQLSASSASGAGGETK